MMIYDDIGGKIGVRLKIRIQSISKNTIFPEFIDFEIIIFLILN